MIKYESDVIVVAAGMSGLCAAVAAAEKGAGVTVFEKGGTVGGAGSMGMGFFGVESHIQKKNLVGLTVDEAFRKFMDFNHWMTDARLVRRLFGMSGSTVKWIEDMGVEFLGVFKYFNTSEQTWHLPKMPGSNRPAERSASLIAKALYDRAAELGVRFVFSAPVTRILKSDSRVTGVLAARSDTGEEIEAEADAVIVCTGGFGDDPEMIRKHLGYEHGRDLFSFRIPGLKGEGMKMVWEAGGGHSPMSMEMTYESPGATGGAAIDTIMRQPNLMVNSDGVRFINEEIKYNTPFTGNAINRQKGRCAYAIITDEIIDYYREHFIDFDSYHKAVSSISEWDEAVSRYFRSETDEHEAIMKGAIMGAPAGQTFFFCEDSPEKLAEAAGIDREGFLKTVEEYNAMCDHGGDVFFGKPNRYMLPIRGKKFYALKYYPSGYGSLGGVRVDEYLRVVTDEMEPIPGLYSAGTDCCAIFGDSYFFSFPGSTMGFAINSGRMAGYNAVDYIDSDDFVE